MILFDEGDEPDGEKEGSRAGSLVIWDRPRRKFYIAQFGDNPSRTSVTMWRPGLFMLGVRAIWASIWPWGE